jgi:hypothetical protein
MDAPEHDATLTIEEREVQGAVRPRLPVRWRIAMIVLAAAALAVAILAATLAGACDGGLALLLFTVAVVLAGTAIAFLGGAAVMLPTSVVAGVLVIGALIGFSAAGCIV